MSASGAEPPKAVRALCAQIKTVHRFWRSPESRRLAAPTRSCSRWPAVWQRTREVTRAYTSKQGTEY